MENPERVYTPVTLARRWQCSSQHIRDMIERGDLKAFRVGGKLLRISAEEVEDYERRNGSP
jgi:excisionase family DNA binding protein